MAARSDELEALPREAAAQPGGRGWSWRRRGRVRPRSARRPTRPRSRGPIRMRSCATSRGTGRIWCIVRRSRPTRRARVIVAVHAESATGHEADSLPVIIDRARWLRHTVAGDRRGRWLRLGRHLPVARAARDHRVHPAAAEHARDRPRARGPGSAARRRSGSVPRSTGSPTARARSQS